MHANFENMLTDVIRYLFTDSDLSEIGVFGGKNYNFIASSSLVPGWPLFLSWSCF
jgi:hypothetical protein